LVAVASSPVFGVSSRSSIIMLTSPRRAQGRCSVRRGTTISSPGRRVTVRSRNSMSSSPSRTKNNSSVSSWWCQMNSPSTLAILTSLPLYRVTILGAQCSEKLPSFSARLTLVGARNSDIKTPHWLPMHPASVQTYHERQLALRTPPLTVAELCSDRISRHYGRLLLL